MSDLQINQDTDTNFLDFIFLTCETFQILTEYVVYLYFKNQFKLICLRIAD